MRKNKNEVTCRRCNLLEAEVYVRFPISTIGKKQVKQYCSLQEEMTNNGIVEHYLNVDYPITPESVKSFADSADYRRNPDVIKKAVPRQNLGDISEIQKVMSNDMTAMRDMYGRMQEIVDKLNQVQQDYEKSVDTAVDNQQAEGEVTNNG